jgi:hypothetical protein
MDKTCSDCLHKDVCQLYSAMKNALKSCSGVNNHTQHQSMAHAETFAERCMDYLVYEEGSLEDDLKVLKELKKTLEWSASMVKVNPNNKKRWISIIIEKKDETWLEQYEENLREGASQIDKIIKKITEK